MPNLDEREITDSWILPDDVMFIPVEALSQRDRDQLDASDGGFALTRRYARSPSKLLDNHSVQLLEQFRSATQITEAIIAHGKSHGLDPRDVLKRAYPLLLSCIDSRFLVPPDSTATSRIVPILVPQDVVDGLEIVRCINLLEDMEVYQARRGHEVVAVKMVRPDQSDLVAGRLRREIAVLRQLDGNIAPRLLADGVFEGRQYLALEWCHGVNPTTIAQEAGTEPDGSAELLRVGQCVLDAYVRLHKRGLLHGDVHPKNILVDGHANVRIVDFEYARVIDSRSKHLDDVPRAGVIHYLEPEYAEALLAHRAVPLASPAGEQYSVAALLYHILTGDRYADFPLDRTEGLRQIVEQPPRPFSQRRRPPWPAVEEILGRALSKDPEKRFPSMGSFAEALRAIDDIPSRAPRLRGAPTEPDLHEFRKNIIERLDLSGPLFSNGFQGRLLCSVTNGSAGIAYALYRMACVTEDPRLLAAADGWIGRAERHLTDSGAFYDEAINITPETVGWTSPYHTESGVHCVRALISLAVGDGATADGAVGRFLEASAHPTDNVDVMLGQAGTLLACTNLLSAVRNRSAVSTTRLAEFGDELLHSICKPLELDPPIDHAGSANLGIAHGWAGLLYTVSRWCMVRRSDLPDFVERRLDELADCAEPSGRGVAWRWLEKGDPRGKLTYASGWCNGSAGFVFLWTLADRLFRRERFAELAEQAAWNTWESMAGPPHLCCGEAGRAYALLNLYRHNGGQTWLNRARALATRAVERRDQIGDDDPLVSERSLYRGPVGIAVLIADLHRPEDACMPFFEDEGWPALA